VSFVAELKQRKVFRVAMVYLVVAWVAIQAASIALPAFDAPAWVLRVCILLFALGFPLALLLTWALDLTPEGIKLATGKVGNKRMAAIAVGLIALALAWYFVGQPSLRSRHEVRMQDRSIAVLPFVNMSGDPANDYFSDGLAETTLDMLAHVQNLKVIARTSSFAFKGKATDMREIGKTLGAAHLLEGSVQQAGDTVRITVQLIRAADGSQLWSRHFDRRMSDVFKIQDEVATAVVQALQLNLLQPEQQRLVRKRTDNVAAYQEYLKGIALLPERKVPDMRKAVKHFERAIQLDPAYAQAYVAAYDVYFLLEQYGTVSDKEKRRATRYLDRALELAPQLGEAHIAHAAALEAAGRYPAAEAEYRLGLKLAPGYATGYQWYGQFLAAVFGRFDEARPLLQRAVELDPLSPVIRAVRATHLGQSGRVDEALLLLNAAIAEHPDIARNYYARSELHQLRGDMVAALRDLRKMGTLDPDPAGARTAQCHLLIDLDALVEAKRCVATWVQRKSASTALTSAQIRLAMIDGDAPAALAFLARMQPVPEDARASILLGTGQAAEALAIYRKLMPGMFAQPTPPVYPGQAFNALEIGIALIETGAKPQGRALLEAAITAIADRPYAAVIAGRGWLDVYAYAYLDKPDSAFGAMQAAVSGGYFLGLAELDTDPLLARLRADPRYMKILAPARARAAAQVNVARIAGLL
jgi:TolB-like protein/Flp pilus assembly protein TadD